MLFDGQGRCLTVNEFGRSTMCSRGDVFMGADFVELWEKPERAAAADALQRVLAGQRATFEAWQDRGGSRTWWSVSMSPLVDDSGRVERFIAIGADITQRWDLEERSRQNLDNLKALCAVTMAITGNFDLNGILAILLEQVQHRLRLDAAAVLLLDHHTLSLQHAASQGFRTTLIHRTKMRIGEGYAGLAAQERQWLVVRDLHEGLALTPPGTRLLGNLAESALVREEGFRGYLAVPLAAKGKIVGVLEVFSRSVLDPDQQTRAFLEALAGQAAVAIDSALLFEEVRRSRDELRLAYDTTIEGWARALDHRDRETEGHSRRVTELTERIAAALGLEGEALLHVRWGALLHDIGKLGVPDGILLKQGPLTPEETQVMRRHTEIAFQILSPIPFLRDALDIPHYHHEWWDGTGYPQGLTGEEIPLAARIFAIVDVWDALLSDRPYRPAWPRERVLAHLRGSAGTHFDPRVLEVFLRTVDDAAPLRPSPAPVPPGEEARAAC